MRASVPVERRIAVAMAALMITKRNSFIDGPWGGNARRPRVDFDLFSGPLNDREFRRRFRVSKSLFQEILSSVKGDLTRNEKQAKRSSGSVISPAWRLAITLRMLAGGDPCGVADMAHVSDKTVWPVVAETVEAINRRFPLAKFDVQDEVKLAGLSAAFSSRSGGVLTGCVGALDGMAVCIRKPRIDECGGKPWHYYNRKGFYALNLQAICDANKRFLYLSIRCPGSTHDSTAFDVSALGMRIDRGEMTKPYWIAGDNAYRASEFIVVPWPGRNLDVWKDSFNFWHSNSRITIECKCRCRYLVIPLLCLKILM